MPCNCQTICNLFMIEFATYCVNKYLSLNSNISHWRGWWVCDVCNNVTIGTVVIFCKKDIIVSCNPTVNKFFIITEGLRIPILSYN